MTEPLRFHLNVAPRLTAVHPASPRVGVQTNSIATVIIAGTPGRRGNQGPPGSGHPVAGETPVGALDGVNAVYTTVNDFAEGSTAVYLNGLREDEYIEVGQNQIMMIDPPSATDKLRIDYMVA